MHIFYGIKFNKWLWELSSLSLYMKDIVANREKCARESSEEGAKTKFKRNTACVCLFFTLFVVTFIDVVVVVVVTIRVVAPLVIGSLLGKSLNMLLNTECAGNLKECFRLIFVVIVHVHSVSLALRLVFSFTIYMFSHPFFMCVLLVGR